MLRYTLERHRLQLCSFHQHMLHQICCIKHAVPNVLHQICCIKHAVSNVLHQICCIKHAVSNVLCLN